MEKDEEGQRRRKRLGEKPQSLNKQCSSFKFFFFFYQIVDIYVLKWAIHLVKCL